MVEPPFAAGAVKGTLTTVVLEADTVPIVGVPGTVVAVTLLEAALDGPVPAAEFPLAVNVYDVAEDRPVTDTGEVDVADSPPGLEVTVYVDGIPPVVEFVTATSTRPLLNARPEPWLVTVATEGASGTSTIFDVPAEASLYFFPLKLESLAFLTAILRYLASER
jgi:hypothetical protein